MKHIIASLILSDLLTAVWGDCPSPPAIPNAHLQKLYTAMKTFPNLAKVFYTCDTGYLKDEGYEFLNCKKSTWEQPSLVCIRRDCGPLKSIANGYYEVPNTLYASVATYYCNKGFRLVGNSRRKCIQSGWNSEAPHCEHTDCGPLPNIEHGHLDLPDASFDSVATYSCDEGFRMIGRSKITCTATGWNSGAPRCERIECESPKNIPNGYLEFDDIGLDSVATYYCNRGFKLFGSNQRRCTDNGWDTVAPRCEFIFCNPPPAVEHVKVLGPPQLMYVYNESVTYACAEHMQLEGERTIQCTENNTWSANPPQCVMKFCSDNLPAVPHAFYVTRETYPVGTAVFYNCETGYQSKISALPSYTQCLENLTWSQPHLNCIRQDCGTPESIENGYVAASSTFLGSVARYICNDGYRMLGHNVRTCTTTGWDSKIPVCEQTSCGVPPALNNGYYIATPNDIIGSRAYYFCSTGYRLVGRNYSECQSSGWDSPARTCERITCQNPEVRNVIKFPKPEGYFFGDTLFLTCIPGFTIKGNNVIKCNERGEWHPEGVMCTKNYEDPSDEHQAANCESVNQRKEFFQCGMKMSDWKSFLEVEKLYLEVRKLQKEIQNLEKTTVDEILDLVLSLLKETRKS